MCLHTTTTTVCAVDVGIICSHGFACGTFLKYFRLVLRAAPLHVVWVIVLCARRFVRRNDCSASTKLQLIQSIIYLYKLFDAARKTNESVWSAMSASSTVGERAGNLCGSREHWVSVYWKITQRNAKSRTLCGLMIVLCGSRKTTVGRRTHSQWHAISITAISPVIHSERYDRNIDAEIDNCAQHTSGLQIEMVIDNRIVQYASHSNQYAPDSSVGSPNRKHMILSSGVCSSTCMLCRVSWVAAATPPTIDRPLPQLCQ